MPKKRFSGVVDSFDYGVKLPKGLFRYKAGNKYRWRVSYYAGGKRKRIGFDTFDEALKYHVEVERQKKEEGERFGALAPNEKRAIEIFRAYQRKCKEENRPCRNLEDCLKDVIAREVSRNTSPLFSKVLHEYMLVFEKKGHSERNNHTFRIRIAVFETAFETKEIAQITTKDIDRVLERLKTRKGTAIAPLSHNHYRAAVHQVMKWAKERNIIDVNPAEQAFKYEISAQEIGIISPIQFRALLTAAREITPELIPVLIAGGFCGVRRAELTRLRWSDIDLERKELKVPHISAKTGKGRFVPIPEAAVQWMRLFLELGHEETEYICQGNTEGKREGFLNRELNKCRRKANMKEWPNNALRHSFASHACAATDNYPQVAAWLGHNGSIQVMMQHYRNVVNKETGEQWFKILPDSSK